MDGNNDRQLLRRVHIGINPSTSSPEKHIALIEPCGCNLEPLKGNEYVDVVCFCTKTTLFEPLNNTPTPDGRVHAGFDPETLEFFAHEIPKAQKSCRCKYLPIEYRDGYEVSEEKTYQRFISALNTRVKDYGLEAVPRWFSKGYAETLHPFHDGKIKLIFGPLAPSSFAQTFCTIFVAVQGRAAHPIDIGTEDCKSLVYPLVQCRCRSCEGYAEGECLCGLCLGPCEVTGRFDEVDDYNDDKDKNEAIECGSEESREQGPQ